MASSVRLFTPAPLAAGAELPLEEAQAHYLGTVIRRGAGDEVHLFNGRDGEWAAEIVALVRGAGRLKIRRQLRAQAAEPDLWLAFALLKRHAVELVVQKATELGAARLLPLLTARTGAERVNQARLRAIAIEAAEQSERLTVPEIAPPQTLAALLGAWPAGRRLTAAVERAAAPAPSPAGTAPAGLLVGPEGGFTPAELDALRAHPFVEWASFGPRILRAETAAIAGLALLAAPSPSH